MDGWMSEWNSEYREGRNEQLLAENHQKGDACTQTGNWKGSIALEKLFFFFPGGQEETDLKWKAAQKHGSELQGPGPQMS